MSEIKPGTRVRVTYEGEYQPHCTDPDCKGVTVGGYGAPPHAPVEVLSPPLPPEPPVGAPLMASFKAGPPALLWREERGYVAQGEQRYYTWAELHEATREVTRLYREDKQPQEKYERVADANSLAMWRHKCGNVTGWNPGVNPDTQMCPHCSKRGDWQQLYVKADSNG